MSILVTGGLGYIGSHTCVALLNAGYDVVVYDDASNSDVSTAQRICEAAGISQQAQRFSFILGDIRDTQKLSDTICTFGVDTAMHFAAKKAVGESVRMPAVYYDTNVGGLLSLLKAMAQNGVSRLIFSSSATVYGDEEPPFTETMPISACNPYGWSKVTCERILMDCAAAADSWYAGLVKTSGTSAMSIAILRYFNPLGAHQSYLLGENPKGIPNNLLPLIVQVAMGQRQKIQVFGGDYPTRDGTCERDYIHVCDVANGHLLALDKLSFGAQVYNIGTGKGNTVLEVISAFEQATGVRMPFEMSTRRQGDIASCFADVQKAKAELGFVAQHTLLDMCRDHYLAAMALYQRAK